MQVIGLLIIITIVIGVGLLVIGLIAIVIDYLFNNQSSKGDISLRLLIYTMIGCGTGFAIGNLLGIGWAIFGMILGGLVAVDIGRRIVAD